MDNSGKLFIEKRQHQRVPRQYNVRYKLMPKDMYSKQSKIDGKSRDISVGGIRVEGNPVGQENDIIRLEVDTGKPGETIIIFAEIRWVENSKDTPGQMGLQFLALREEDVDVIKQLIMDNVQE
jgi:c-di-GMP-binding flagellar brake protein YcgR